MADGDTGAQDQAPPAPNPALRRLDVLVGTWDMKGRESGPEGEIHGRLVFEWLEGGYFLVQHFDIDHLGRRAKGIEIIGYGRDWGGQASEDCTSQMFDNTGNAFSYTWDVEEETITIWGGQRGSSAAFKGRFSDDRNTVTGAWEWPGGGYQATMTRVRNG
ncbi:MAG TPA: hypothetical protein VHS99_25455 [Chloroflexota bacterium]|jgi:hypothetical protein|nr:hypothetical protein [Chloroflexota bacterium]